MSNRLIDRADFSIPNNLLDEHEWVVDAAIDDLGTSCTAHYPPSITECPNCIYDPVTNRSSDMYKSEGPFPFTNFTTCPYCGGVGKKEVPATDSIKLRVYFGGSELNTAIKYFNKLSAEKFTDTPAGVIFVIGYMENIVNFKRANYITINTPPVEIRCKRSSSPIPWGFRKNRYFAAILTIE
jgi:hypothetical protein